MTSDFRNMTLEQLIEEKEKILKANPELSKFQDEIDKLLDKSGGSENRAQVAKLLMEISVRKLKTYVDDVKKNGFS